LFSGTIQVDGDDADGSDAGGGSGGTIVIDTPVLSGNGEIRANGGQGTGDGGGGAGGRMAVTVSTE